MPIYEYECRKCGHQMEVWQKFSDTPLAKCELCRGKLKKIISQNTFHLKGTGWYVTDYSSKSGSQNAKKKESPSSEAKKTEPSKSKDQSAASSAKSES
ncbi:MAG: FmdB family transcriptional regulator [Deltaproteobacteria bacterium HGW-Deltaproteobacteria-21]|nr:MAG: FmdB family transcriptional regulator [Deltaproteobacteria bacterium HGW-Deltaproteobacteria-21]